ncbi:FMN-binding protein [Kribbella sp. NPDC054772]
MRRGVKVLMTVATTAVVAVAFRASLQSSHNGMTAAVVVPTEHSKRAGGTQPSPRPGRTGHRTSPPPRSTAPTPRIPTTPTAPRSTAAPTPHSTARPTAAAVTVAGGVVDTQYGPVQVEITVRGGRITKAHTLQHPSGDGQTDQINSNAVPQLNHETLAAQSAQIDTVSGATFTSEGYRQSLQSALDAAHQAGAR